MNKYLKRSCWLNMATSVFFVFPAIFLVYVINILYVVLNCSICFHVAGGSYSEPCPPTKECEFNLIFALVIILCILFLIVLFLIPFIGSMMILLNRVKQRKRIKTILCFGSVVSPITCIAYAIACFVFCRSAMENYAIGIDLDNNDILQATISVCVLVLSAFSAYNTGKALKANK